VQTYYVRFSHKYSLMSTEHSKQFWLQFIQTLVLN